MKSDKWLTAEDARARTEEARVARVVNAKGKLQDLIINASDRGCNSITFSYFTSDSSLFVFLEKSRYDVIYEDFIESGYKVTTGEWKNAETYGSMQDEYFSSIKIEW